MDPRTAAPLVPLHLTSFAILSPQNAPLYVHSFTGKEDELRHYHLSHAALDVIEERSEWAVLVSQSHRRRVLCSEGVRSVVQLSLYCVHPNNQYNPSAAARSG